MRRVATFLGTAAVVMMAASVYAQAAPMVLKQDAKTLTITRTVGENQLVTTYNLDGSPSKNTGMGRGGEAPPAVTSTAKWDGAKLVVTSDNGQTITYAMDGAWLTISTTRPGREGGPATTNVQYYKK
jgi:hypothetical protein